MLPYQLSIPRLYTWIFILLVLTQLVVLFENSRIYSLHLLSPSTHTHTHTHNQHTFLLNWNECVQVVAPIKAKSRLRFRLNTSKFAPNPEKSATSTLGLVDGNSTITVNTMGDTTDDSSGEHKKGIDLAPANTVSAFNNYSPSWREVSVSCLLFFFPFCSFQFECVCVCGCVCLSRLRPLVSILWFPFFHFSMFILLLVYVLFFAWFCLLASG